MKTLETISGRKSIRNFNGESTTETEPKEMLKAANPLAGINKED